MNLGNIIIGQSGGPTAVINSSLAGLIKGAKENGANKIYGMINGIQGLIERKYVDLEKQITTNLDMELLIRTPSSFLGSCRYKLPNIEEGKEVYEKLFEILEELDISCFFYIGGNDSMDTIKKLSEYAKLNNKKTLFIGVPKTIDNDLAITDHTPGFGSACKYIATTVKELIKDSTVYDTKSVTIIEVMGRNAGWLTASSALTKGQDCSGPDLIYLPEVAFNIEKFINKISELQKTKKSLVVVVSEGIKSENGKYICEANLKDEFTDSFGHKILTGTAINLANILTKKLGCKTRAIEINTSQRCASHISSKTDVDEAFLAGEFAIKFASNGETGKVVIFKRTSENPYKIDISSHSVKDIANFEKTVPLEWIINDGTYVSKEIINYISPLIQGEVIPIIVDGLPAHLSLKN